MVSVKINPTELKRVAGRIFKSHVERYVLPDVRRRLKEANKILLKRFLTHEITQEIANGPNATNTSGTLNGYGNLFSFMGFEEGSDPIGELAELLSNSIELSSYRLVAGGTRVEISVKMPSKDDIKAMSELPWITKSWVFAIESGLSGLGKYLYEDADFLEASRSGSGVQLAKTIRPGQFKPQRYMSEILKDVSKRVVQAIREAA
jgi:hypothetical protein